MTAVAIGLVVALLAWLVSLIFGSFISEELIKSISKTVFNIDVLIEDTFKSSFFSQISVLFYSVSISIIIFKFVKKGFSTYVLWRDGDPDESPSLLFTNFVVAIVVLFIFNPFFDLTVNVFENITNTIFNLVDVNKEIFVPPGMFDPEMLEQMGNLKEANKSTIDATLGLFTGAILAISAIILYFKLIIKGVEIYILKLGLPIATIGLVDNDGGMFKEYVNTFIQALTTISIQIILFKMGIVISNAHAVIGSCFVIFALRVPEVLNKFVITSRGGVASSVYHSSRMVIGPIQSLFKMRRTQ